MSENYKPYYFVAHNGKLYRIEGNVPEPASTNEATLSIEPANTGDNETVTVTDVQVTTVQMPVTTTVVQKPSQAKTAREAAQATSIGKPVYSSVRKPVQTSVRKVAQTSSKQPAQTTSTQKCAPAISDPKPSPTTSDSGSAASVQKKVRQTTTEKKRIKKERIQDVFSDVFEAEDAIFCIEASLLEQIFLRPPLFDSSLSIVERSTDVRVELFKEIASILNDQFETDKITWKIVSNTWEQHRTLYIRYRNAKKAIQSGSETARLPPLPAHIEILRNYDAVIKKREQASSLSDCLSMNPPQKRKTKQDDVGIYLKTATNFLKTIQTSRTTSSTPPAPVQSNPTSSTTRTLESHPTLAFFYSLLPYIEKLGLRKEMSFRKKVFDILCGIMDKEGQTEIAENENFEENLIIETENIISDETVDCEDESEKERDDLHSQDRLVNPYDSFYGLDIIDSDDDDE